MPKGRWIQTAGVASPSWWAKEPEGREMKWQNISKEFTGRKSPERLRGPLPKSPLPLFWGSHSPMVGGGPSAGRTVNVRASSLGLRPFRRCLLISKMHFHSAYHVTFNYGHINSSDPEVRHCAKCSTFTVLFHLPNALCRGGCYPHLQRR